MMMTNTTFVSSRSYQSIMNDETLCPDDLTTLNHNSSWSIFYRSLNIQYLSQQYLLAKENSSSLMQTESIADRTNGNAQEMIESSKSLRKSTPRQTALIELIGSEQRFVRDMKNILKTYITPMLENKILSSSHIDALFLNWPSLTRTHEKLANALLTALKTAGEEISVGQILCEFIPELISEYEVYFRFHPTAMKCFREQLELSNKFRAFMQKTKEQTSGIGTMGDANILTLPLQRIAKYPVLIYQVIKNTSNNSSDLLSLHNSLKKANELRETINNAIDEEINRTKFDWLQTHVDCTKITETIVFNSLTHFGDQRKLIHYHHLKSNNRSLYAMLFNDFLLFTRIKRPIITKFYQIIHRTMSKVQSTMDWFDAPEGDHIYLIVYKKPIMLHEIRNLRINESNSRSFQFDYRGQSIICSTNSDNERLLWMKYMNETIDICRRRRLITSMLRAPELNIHSLIDRSIGEIFIGEIHANNLPLISTQKHGNNPYCIVEMNHCQRQTTAVLCETCHCQWNMTFRYFIDDLTHDTIQCSIYNRSIFSTDRLLGSVEIPLRSLIEGEDSLSVHSLANSHLSDQSMKNWKRRTYSLQHSSSNSQLSLKYHLHFYEQSF